MYQRVLEMSVEDKLGCRTSRLTVLSQAAKASISFVTVCLAPGISVWEHHRNVSGFCREPELVFTDALLLEKVNVRPLCSTEPARIRGSRI